MILILKRPCSHKIQKEALLIDSKYNIEISTLFADDRV